MEKKRNLKQRLKIGKTIFFKDVKHAKWAILSVFAYFVLLRKFFIIICPAVLITGLPCPGCGMTRALIRLLHLDFAGAWQMHPFVYLFMIFILWFGIRRYILGISDTKKAWKNSCHAWNIDDFVLYLADAPVFSRKPANELLLWKCVIESAPYY